MTVTIENVDACLSFLDARGVNVQGLSAEAAHNPKQRTSCSSLSEKGGRLNRRLVFVASSVLDVVEDSIKTVAAQRGFIGKVSNCGQPVEGICYLRSVALCDVSFGNSSLHILAKTLLLNKLHKRYNDALCVAKLYTVTVNRRPIKHTYDLTTAKTNIYSYMAYPPTHTVCTHPRAQLSDA
ncbi:Neuron navigator 3 [Collichthys lucidus]|uniref:Neuron navigator 3 n=1 Tax=Collichthys lucidus TaxID=240159 RepID=A0A4U5VR28_COLLU|nr:Neuron navigator 3 [Collichthys lucidus]